MKKRKKYTSSGLWTPKKPRSWDEWSSLALCNVSPETERKKDGQLVGEFLLKDEKQKEGVFVAVN